jgi:transcription antitermination factor NusG
MTMITTDIATMPYEADPAGPGGAGGAVAAAARWRVLHTKSRQEKALAETLETRGLRVFLPLIKAPRYYGRRKLVSELPLFAGYVFLHGTLDEVYTADRTKRVAQIIEVCDQAKLETELENIRKALAHEDTFDPFPFLTRGVRVVVASGPLRGVRGMIEDRTKRNRLILQIDVLGQATSLEIDGSLLEVAE